MNPAEQVREKLIYFLEQVPHLKDRTPDARRAEASRLIDEYAHELAERQRAVLSDVMDRWFGNLHQDAISEVIDLIDPEVKR